VIRDVIGITEVKVLHLAHEYYCASIISGPLQLPEGKECKVFDITGRIVKSTKITLGIYFLEVDNKIVQKVVKVR